MLLLLPFTIVLVVTIVIYLIHFHYSRRRLFELAKKIPGDDGLPIVGHATEYFGDGVDMMTTMWKFAQNTLNNNGISKRWHGYQFMIRLTDPEDVEIVMTNTLQKGDIYKFFGSWVDVSLLHSDVSIWRPHRKIMNHTFNQKILDNYVDVFSKNSIIFTQCLEKKSDKKTFDVYPYVCKCVIDTLCETNLGVQMKAQTEGNAYVDAAQKQTHLIFKRALKFWLHSDWVYQLTSHHKEDVENVKILRGYTSNVVRRKLQQFKQDSSSILEDITEKRSPLVDNLIKLTQETEKWSVEELQGETDIMLAAGNDTTSVASAYTLMMLGRYPEIQEKAFQEQLEIFGDSDRPVEKDDLPKMQYLERVIKETLRLLPPISIIIRKIEKEMDITNYTLPADSNCIIFIMGMHRDPKVWGDDASEFDPDRFLPENSTHRKTINYLPFGFGTRNCIGFKYAMMFLKTFTSTVIRKYKLKCDYDHKNLKIALAISQKPEDGILISMEKRKN